SAAAEKAKPTQTRREYVPTGSALACRFFCRTKPVQWAASQIAGLLKSPLHPAKDGLLSSLPFLALDRMC
ncbi:hypothetical protein, partial [Rheinheimera sp.]|uniref:hypothetical protein n=1 Tax=Rheinheimera sp. TaxID=1869214 RepID=UPI003AF9C9E6